MHDRHVAREGHRRRVRDDVAAVVREDRRGRGRGKGFLRISVERPEDPGPGGEVCVRVVSEVANFYPMLAGWGWWARIGTVIYRITQYTIHNIVTNAFFRSLAQLDLAESKVGRFRPRLPSVGAYRAPESARFDPPPRETELADTRAADLS